MRTLKIILFSYIGSNIGFLFGEQVITKISGDKIDLMGMLTSGVTNFPPVLLGLVLSGLIGTILGASYIKKGKIRALIGGSGAYLGLTVATFVIYNVSAFKTIYFLVYPLLSYSGWELGMYVLKNYVHLDEAEESVSE